MLNTAQASATTRDPGLQAERTSLAWSRTMLAMVINALIIFKFALTQRHGQGDGVGLALIAVVSFAAAAAIARQIFVSQAAHTVSLASSVRLVAFCCMAVCVIGMVTMLTR